MNLNINLATRVYVNFKQVNYILMLLFLLCCSWLAFNLNMFVANLDEINRYAGFMARKSRGAEGKVIPDAEYNKFLAKVKYANNILYKRSYDWLSLLENLEQLVPSGVSLKSLDPSTKGESLKLTGTAAGFSSIRKFMENLEASKAFTEIYLIDQSIARIDNKRKAVNFTVTCKALHS
jgi:type IV pilus assembly protein PilN